MSYSEIRADGLAARPAIGASTNERALFIGKVYGLMLVGLIVFALSTAMPIVGAIMDIPLLSGIFYAAIQLHPLFALLLLIGSSFVVHAVAMVRYLNLAAFFFFAAFWGFISIPLFGYVLASVGMAPIIQGLGLTILVFGGLSGYVLLTRKDFSFMGGFLMVGLISLLGVIFFALLGNFFFGMQFELLHIAISIFAVLLFSGYVLYDTSNLLHRYSTDMVVPAALALMVDFIILFRNIVYLLAISRN